MLAHFGEIGGYAGSSVGFFLILVAQIENFPRNRWNIFLQTVFFRDFLRKVYIFHTFRGCTRADFCGTIALVNHIVSEKRSA